MTFFKNIKFIAVICLIALLSSCKSYDIPYDKNLSSSKIDAGIYVTEAPAPSVNFKGGALIIIGKIALHEKDIKTAYSETDIREIFYQELTKNGSNISPKFVASISTADDKKIILSEMPEISEKDPKACEFVFDDIPHQIGKDYLLVIKVIDYGFLEGSFSVNSRIHYIASIIDMKNNKKVWQMRNKNEASYPILSGFSTAKNSSNVRENLRDCVAGVIQQIAQDINKTVK